MPEQREVIVARHWGGLSFEQIAEVVGCSASTAFRRYTAGVEDLRKQLGVIMSEPFLERLSRFTPDAGGLDRDALLFAAGRALRPPEPRLDHPGRPAGRHPGRCRWSCCGRTRRPARRPMCPWPSSPCPRLPRLSSLRTSEASASPGLWSARHSLLESETEDRPARRRRDLYR